MDIKIFILVLSCAIGIAIGQLRCYACGFSTSDTDRSCLTITNDTRIVNCPFKYCTILRQEYLDPAGVVASFNRGCEQEPDHLNHEISDSDFRTFYRACTNDICNVGNGIEFTAGGNLSPAREYSGENILVPGTRGNALRLTAGILTSIISIFVISFLQ